MTASSNWRWVVSCKASSLQFDQRTGEQETESRKLEDSRQFLAYKNTGRRQSTTTSNILQVWSTYTQNELAANQNRETVKKPKTVENPVNSAKQKRRPKQKWQEKVVKITCKKHFPLLN